MAKVKLCRMPFIDINYSNVIDFETKVQRNNYFNKLVGFTFEKNIKSHSNLTSISMNYPIDKLYDYDYLILDDKFFYFVINQEVINDNNSTLYLKLDVFNTYYYDINILPSFVDRCHVPRWNGEIPTYNMEDEELGIGEYIHLGNEDICKMGDSIIIATSVPIGYVPGSSFGGGDDSGSWENGKMSSKGYRMLKGFEGFAPNSYTDSGGYWTIAYGITKHGEPDIYASMVAQSPLEEEIGARASYECLTKNYGLKIIDAFRNMGCTQQYQFDALVDLAFNSGYGSITGSNVLTNAIVKDPTDESVIRPIWESYKTNGGLAGLVARRKSECDLFFNKEPEIRPITIIGSGGTVTDNNGDGWLPSETSGEVEGYKVFNNDYGEFMCPVKNAKVTSKYGWRIHPISGDKKFHHGTDIALPTGSTTVASVNGTITQTGFDVSMGNYIYLDSGGYRVKYMHLSKITVTKDQQVKRGEKVGEIGSTGASTGSHCHWEIRRISDNESTDPAPSLMKGDTV